MHNFPSVFCKTPLLHKICQWFSFENVTVSTEDSKTKFFGELVPIIRLRRAIVFFSNVPSAKFQTIHSLSMRLNPLHQTCIHPRTGLNRLLSPINSSAELFVEEECRCRVPSRRFCNGWNIEKGIKDFNESP